MRQLAHQCDVDNYDSDNIQFLSGYRLLCIESLRTCNRLLLFESVLPF